MMQPVLTIAGSDPSGGAGVQADLKTFSSLGVYGMAVITALTAQNTQGVSGILPVPSDFVARQIDSVLSDIAPQAVKTGMLVSAEVVDSVSERLRAYKVSPLVVDPVVISTSGTRLLDDTGVARLKEVLLPLCTLVTPNLEEASVLTGMEVRDEASMEEAARRLHRLGTRYVLVKGGHLSGEAMDLFFDGADVDRWSSPRIETKNLHGTGCVLSAAITAYLARGLSMKEAVFSGKGFVTESIRRGLSLGLGPGPVNPTRERND